jgi:hypothetical protein
VKRRPGRGGFTIELVFPWEKEFNVPLRRAGLRASQVTPRPGAGFGFNLLLLDDDGPGPGQYLALAPGLPLGRTRTGSFAADVYPAWWARVVLE